MKSYLLAALIAMSAFAFGAPDASAGGCRGPYCGESRNGPYPQPYPGYYPEIIRTYVTINIFVSDRPAPGFGTDIQIRAGSSIEVSCDRFDWCRVLSPRFRNLFVPKYCLGYFRPSWRPNHDNGYGGRPYREYGGGAFEEPRNEERYENDRPPYNGNGYNGGY